MSYTKNILIITGGSLDDSLADQLITENDYDTVIASDRGAGYFCRTGRKPDIVLGDFDSAAPEEIEQLRSMGIEPQRYPAEKDWTDTELAVRHAIELGAEQITLLGATGSRIDHVLGNLGLLGMALDAGAELVMMDGNNRIRMTDHELTIKKVEQYGSYVSLYPLGGIVKGLALEGFKYPLTNAQVTPWQSLCISNEITEEIARIRLTEGRLLVIESQD